MGKMIGRGEVPRLTEVKPGPGSYELAARYKDGSRVRADMTGVIYRLKVFGPLRDPEAFAQVRLTETGSGIEWPAGVDYSAGALAILARAQRGMTGRDFVTWQKAMGLSNQEAADVLGVTARTIKNYRAAGGDPIPAHAAMACWAIEQEPILLHARIRPHEPGRPRGRLAPARTKSAA